MTKILIIEDTRDLREDLVEVLALEGYQVLGAENGLIGLDLARQHKPDLILCDIMMPELDGYGVLEALRNDSEIATIPFIFTTARSERVSMRQGMVLGADDYLIKPFMVTELLDSVKTQLRKRAELNEAAERHLASLRESIATALPHELRTPLNTIMGFSEMLKSEAQRIKPDQIYLWAEHINDASYRLYRLFENYLFYVQLQVQGSEKISRRSNEALEEFTFFVETHAQHIAHNHQRLDDLEVTLEPVKDIFIMEKDLAKIVQELTDNAFKFSKKGQHVIVKGKCDDKQYSLSIQDFGLGLTQEKAQKAGAYMQFERWLREQQGLGLGLAIVKHLAQAYGFEWKVDGEENVGTTVFCIFKRA